MSRMSRERWLKQLAEERLPGEVARRLGREGLSRIWTPDQTARRYEQRQKDGSLGGFSLDRRGFLLKSAAAGGAVSGMTLLQACGPMQPTGPADGSFELPYTSAEPGTDPHYHLPAVYAALVDGTNIRIWVEVIDLTVNVGQLHPQEATHYVKQLLILDQHGNEIAASGYRYDQDARLVVQVTIPAEVQYIRVLEECNLHGWWASEYDVSALAVPPVGDLRRPYTQAQPGEVPAKHDPLFGKRPNGDYSIEIGNRNGEGLHPMTPEHYEGTILVFDQYSQLRAGTYLDPDYNPEPVYDFDPVGGTGYIRIVAYCNLHGWWEGVYSVT